MGKPLRRTATAALSALLVIAAGVACGNTTAKGGGGTGQKAGKGVTCKSNSPRQGVTDSEIRVGGLASKTNPLGFNYGQAWDGTEAYFKMINQQGGVFGRKLNLAVKEDDQVGSNAQATQRLASSDNVFAVAPVASLLFTGAKTLAQNCIPTFGWNINPEWSSGPSMFGDKGSNLGIKQPNLGAAWLTKKLNAKKVGVLAYNITESKQCATGLQNTYKQFPGLTKVAFTDSAVPYPLTDISGDVSKMKSQGVDMVIACVDVNGMATVAREMKKQNFDATLFLPDGYYPQVKSNPNFIGSYAVTFFVPFEVPNPPPGLKQYLSWMKKTNGPINEISLAGWVAADMLVTGIKKAGKNFDRSKVVAALNKMTDYTANGILPGIDWTIAHTSKWRPNCAAYSEVRKGKFVPRFGQPGKPFVCLVTKANSHTIPEPTYK